MKATDETRMGRTGVGTQGQAMRFASCGSWSQQDTPDARILSGPNRKVAYSCHAARGRSGGSKCGKREKCHPKTSGQLVSDALAGFIV